MCVRVGGGWCGGRDVVCVCVCVCVCGGVEGGVEGGRWGGGGEGGGSKERECARLHPASLAPFPTLLHHHHHILVTQRKT